MENKCDTCWYQDYCEVTRMELVSPALIDKIAAMGTKLAVVIYECGSYAQVEVK